MTSDSRLAEQSTDQKQGRRLKAKQVHSTVFLRGQGRENSATTRILFRRLSLVKVQQCQQPSTVMFFGILTVRR